MTKYLIKLSPLDTFFFSQENKYRKKKGKNKTNEYEADYYQKSAHFPQQTTVFGMLRYYLLLINDQIPITNSAEAEKLIGKNSFNIGTENPDFGKINNISSVFILDENNNCFYKNPKDIIENEGELKYLNKAVAPFKSNLSKGILFFDNYVEKSGLNNFLFHSEDKYMALDFDKDYEEKVKKNKQIPNGIFVEKERVGITKSKTGVTEQKAFYKQVFYSLLNGYSFAFTADLDYVFEDNHTGFVSMGAEKSIFKISIQKFNDGLIKDIELPNINSPKIVLQSDTYISDYDKNNFQFAISSTKSFRFLITELKEGNKYYSSNPLKKDLKKITRSNKFNLFEKGSVFYFKDEEQMNTFSEKILGEIEHNNKHKNFVQIGYNQHLKIK